VISLLAPAALAGLAAVAAPVVVHLLTHRRMQTRPFPALAFVLGARAGRAAPSRLRDLAVLLLRALALLALILALSGPLWQALPGAARQPAVIILDASASMRQRTAGGTSWSHALAAAGRLSEELGDRPLLLLVAGRPLERSSPAPLSDRGPLRALLGTAQPGWGSGATVEALALAGDLLRGSGGDCWLVGDGSRGAWAGVDPQSLPKGVRLHPVAVSGGGANLAVRALALSPALAVRGRPLEVRAELANYGGAAVHAMVRVRLGEEQRDDQVEVGADATAVVVERFTPQGDMRWLALSAAIITRDDGGDALPEDDRRDGAVELLPAIPVTVASDGDAADPRGPLKPLLAALAAAGLAPEVIPGAGLAAWPGEGHGARRVLVTAGLAHLPDAAPFAAHLLNGGAWLQVLVSEADARLARALPDLAPPGLPGALVDLSGTRGLGLGPVRSDHPLLAGLRGREALLAEVTAWRYRPLVLGEGARALLSWSDGSPALCERAVGSGRWLLLGISPAEADSSLAALEATPLLVEPLGRVLLPPRRGDAAEPCDGRVTATRPLLRPDGSAAPLFDGSCILDRPGLWHDDERLVAAAIPALESDLRVIAPPGGAEAQTDAAGAARAAGTRPLWHWLLLGGVLLLALEQLVAGGRRQGRP
jgi:Aerotolerance regulator N-terminal